MYRKSFAEQHPVLLGVGILLGACTVAALWPLFLILAVLGGVGWGLWVSTRRYDQRQLADARRRALIAAHADYEHRLWMQGDSRGFYGRYPAAL